MKRLDHPSSLRPATVHRGRRALALLALVVGVFLAGVTLSRSAASQAAPAYQVVVNVKNPIGAVNRDFLSDVFLKRASEWHTSEHALPVDLRPASTVRRAFSLRVLKRPVDAVRRYWTQRIFSGRDVPPPELDSEDAVLRYVASHPGAVGYVSPGVTFPGVKPLEVD